DQVAGRRRPGRGSSGKARPEGVSERGPQCRSTSPRLKGAYLYTPKCVSLGPKVRISRPQSAYLCTPKCVPLHPKVRTSTPHRGPKNCCNLLRSKGILGVRFFPSSF